MYRIGDEPSPREGFFYLDMIPYQTIVLNNKSVL